MLVLGIETSCDETAAAVLENGTRLRSNVIASQDEIHSQFGGIVPELAGRSHVERIHHIIETALKEAGVTLHDIDLIAATQGPGLVVSLLVGLNTAKALAYSLDIPVMGINHLEGHVLAIFLQEEVPFPFLALIVSGGHTDLCRVDGFGRYRILGRTRDDAAGESFDKVAKMLGLGFPGGPLIEKIARQGNAEAHDFPRAWLGKDSLDFSFSGLKTAVRNTLAKHQNGSSPAEEDIAAGFQEAVVEVLVRKSLTACRQESLKRIVVTGGVAANRYLKDRMTAAAQKEGIDVFVPKPVLCTDNAAMIACAGYYRFRDGLDSENDLFSLDAHPNLPL